MAKHIVKLTIAVELEVPEGISLDDAVDELCSESDYSVALESSQGVKVIGTELRETDY